MRVRGDDWRQRNTRDYFYLFDLQAFFELTRVGERGVLATRHAISGTVSAFRRMFDMGVELGLWVVVGLCVFAFIVPPLCNALEDKLVYKDDGYGRALAGFFDEARKRGLTYQQASDELRGREALAQLRRTASDAVRANPGNWYQAIQASKEKVLSDLRAERPDIAKAVAASLNDLSYGHILYRHEAELVDRLSVPTRNAGPTQDRIAALRITR